MKRSEKALLAFVRERGETAFRDMMIAFGVSKGGRREFKAFVDRFVDEGKLVHLKGNRYGIGESLPTMTGRLVFHPDGYAFLVPEEGEDLYIPSRSLAGSLQGDLVEARVVRGLRGRREGRIVRTVTRGVKSVVGRYEAGAGGGFVIPSDRRITADFFIPPRMAQNALPGQVVVAEVTAYPSERLPPRGRVVQVLGWPGDPEVEVAAIIHKHVLPTVFSEETLEEARRVALPPHEADLAGRRDLRGLQIVTIDGETARDFDDAVCVLREGRGYRLYVSIADVSHYVRSGSHIDREAYERGTSVYFPDRAIAMLPEILSNGICSLNPNENRLAMTAEMLFDGSGVMLEADFYPSVIRSAARLTYTGVRRVLVDHDRTECERLHEFLDHFRDMEELAAILTRRRRSRGSIDFDLPEPQIIIGLQGEIEAIVRGERNVAHRIIEEFMLAANEAVASFIEERGVPSLYRVHEPPDPQKIADFRDFLAEFGFDLPLRQGKVAPGDLQRLLERVEGAPEERMINTILLRYMKQARYSEDNVGHFGLASPSYTHFTSPIRRYPDLVVHRILRKVLSGKMGAHDVERLQETLPETAVHTSKRERVAMEAERDVADVMKIRFMRSKLGEEHYGFISGVLSFGFFVELEEFFVEGLVHVSSLRDDFYDFIEERHILAGSRTGRTFRIGDRVLVRVAAASVEKRQIDFVLAEFAAPAADSRRIPPLRGRRRRG